MHINIDDDQFHQAVIEAVTESVDFDRHVNDLVDSLLNDQIEEHLGRLDIDDIDDFERRSEEIARDVVAESLDDEVRGIVQDVLDGQDPNGATLLDDRVTNLEEQVEALTDTVNRLVDALSAAALLLGVVAKG